VNEVRKPLLIVEDDPALQTQMKWAFDAYEVAVASDRESALAQVRRLEPAVITLDLGLPPLPDEPTEGLATLQQILTLLPGCQGDRAHRPERSRERASGDRARCV
jgi:two-component system NtrC family response regulator